MFQKFYENNITSKFIKSLLANTPIPTVNSCADGDLMIPGCTYVKDNFIVKCEGIEPNGDYRLNQIIPYDFGQQYNGYTTTYVSNVSGYDSTTHYYLGQYLRTYRDVYGIDLMPFYNCYNSTYIRDIRLYEENSKPTFKVIYDPKNYEDDYKVMAIPIKFNKTYTIAIDCPLPYYIMPMLYGNKGLIFLNDHNKQSFVNGWSTLAKKIKGSRFNTPYTYSLNVYDIPPQFNVDGADEHKVAETYMSYENFLYLIIQLPITNDSSVVVLEGDYTNLKSNKIFQLNAVENTKQLNSLLLSELSLLRVSDKNTYAFSDRLIEYLLLNPITNADDITLNVERIQSYASSLTNQRVNNYTPFNPKNESKGVWSNELRKYLYELTMSSRYLYNKFDINGFVDKDVEKIITRGHNV